MKYTKPEVVALGRATDAVQSHSKPGGNIETPMTTSTSAYEADE
jgi:hypothetical protein